MAKKQPKSGGEIKTFMDSASPNFSHTEPLRSADQAALQVKFKNDRMRDEHRDSPMSMPLGPGDDWAKDYEDRNRVAKRKDRGGATYRPGDGIAR